MQGDLGGRRREVAQPRPGPAGRLRGQPGRELRPAAQAAGPRAVHRRDAGGAGRRDVSAERRARREGPGLAEDRRAPQRRGDPPHAAGPRARAAEPAPAEDGDPGPVGRGAADGHAHRDLPAHRLPERLHPGRHPEPPGPTRAVRAAPAADLRLRHRDRDPRGRRRRSPAHRGRPALRAAPLPHRRGLPGRPPGSSPTPPSPPGRPRCGARGRPRSHRTPPTSPPSTRTSSPSGTRATAGPSAAS